MQDSSNTEKAALRKSSVLFAESESSVVDGTRIIRTRLQQKRFEEERGKKRKIEEDKGKKNLSKAGAAMHWKGELGVIVKSPMVNQEQVREISLKNDMEKLVSTSGPGTD